MQKSDYIARLADEFFDVNSRTTLEIGDLDTRFNRIEQRLVTIEELPRLPLVLPWIDASFILRILCWLIMTLRLKMNGTINQPKPKNVFSLVALLLDASRDVFLSCLGEGCSSLRVSNMLLMVFCCISIFLFINPSKLSCWWAKLSYNFVISDWMRSCMKSSFILLSLNSSLVSKMALEFKLIYFTLSWSEFKVLLMEGRSKNC